MCGSIDGNIRCYNSDVGRWFLVLAVQFFHIFIIKLNCIILYMINILMVKDFKFDYVCVNYRNIHDWMLQSFLSSSSKLSNQLFILGSSGLKDLRSCYHNLPKFRALLPWNALSSIYWLFFRKELSNLICSSRISFRHHFGTSIPSLGAEPINEQTEEI